MPSTPAEFRIGDTWNGLNRAVAPQDLSPSQSPDTTDARNYNRQLGALGPRLGRSRILTKTNSILGFGMLVAPFGRFTLTATADGTWIQEALAWAGVTPATPTTPSVTGMDTSAGVRYLQYKNRTYAFNGRNRPRCFDGNKVTLMGILGGIDYPQWTPTIALGAAPAAPVKYLSLAVLATNVVTLTTALPHGFVVGQSVVVNVTAGSTVYNGTWVIASTPLTTTFTYAVTHANIPSATVAGTVTAAVALQTKIATVASNVVTVTTWLSHGFISGQTVTFINAIYPYFSSNSPFTITVTGATTFTFPLGATIADGTYYDLSGTSPSQSGMDVYTGTLGSPGSAGITGTFYYMVAAANSTKLEPQGRAVEGIPSGLSVVAAPVSQAVTVGGIPATHVDPQVDQWRIYRTLSGQFDTGLVPDQQDFFLLATVALGTTSYIDTIDDATGWYLNSTNFNRLRFNQNIPPTFKYAALYGDRMFACGFDPISSSTVTTAASKTVTLAAGTWPDGVKGCYFRQNGDNSVYEIAAQPTGTTITLDRSFTGSTGSGKGYSIYRNPWEVYYSEFMSVEAWGPDGEGLRYKLEVPGHQSVTGLCQFEGHLLIFTATEIYVISGKGPSRFDIQMLPDPAYSGLGAVSGDAIMRCDNEVHFLSQDGPAMVSAVSQFFSPTLYGIELNTDWLDDLTAQEQALAVCGTDGRSCWYSVVASGQLMNSKTFRFERDKQSWWEETEVCPYRYIRQDGTGNVLQALYYIQGASVMRAGFGVEDLVDNAFAGNSAPVGFVLHVSIAANILTVTAVTELGFAVNDQVNLVLVTNSALNGVYTVLSVVDLFNFTVAKTHANLDSDDAGSVTLTSDKTVFYVPAATFPTTLGGLVECYVRFYDSAGVFKGSRRILSNTTTTFTIGTDLTLPGSGGMPASTVNGGTFEIGNIGWRWTSKSYDAVDPLRKTRTHLHKAEEIWATFYAMDNAATLALTDSINGVLSTKPQTASLLNLTHKFDIQKDCFEYASLIASRNGALMKSLSIRGLVESENV